MDWQLEWHRFGQNLKIQIQLKLKSRGMQDNCAKQGLQPLPAFTEKIIQLYEMIVVRHGLMLVGQSFGMKTAAHSVLAAALSDLHEKVSVSATLQSAARHNTKPVQGLLHHLQVRLTSL